jgi:hypothetical protein
MDYVQVGQNGFLCMIQFVRGGESVCQWINYHILPRSYRIPQLAVYLPIVTVVELINSSWPRLTCKIFSIRDRDMCRSLLM